MLNRFTVSLSLALLAAFGSTGAAFAADYSDKAYVMVGTGGVVLGLMLLIVIGYGAKLFLGLLPAPPAAAPAAHGAESHAADSHAADAHAGDAHGADAHAAHH